MKRFLVIATVLCMVTLIQAESRAQFGAGAYAGYNLKAEAVMAGVEARIGLAKLTGGSVPITLVPSYEMYFGIDDPFDTNPGLSQFDVNVIYSLPISNSPVSPYIGGGLGVVTSTASVSGISLSHSETGFNVLGGAQINAGSVAPFARVRASFVDSQTWVSLSGGAVVHF